MSKPKEYRIGSVTGIAPTKAQARDDAIHRASDALTDTGATFYRFGPLTCCLYKDGADYSYVIIDDDVVRRSHGEAGRFLPCVQSMAGDRAEVERRMRSHVASWLFEPYGSDGLVVDDAVTIIRADDRQECIRYNRWQRAYRYAIDAMGCSDDGARDVADHNRDNQAFDRPLVKTEKRNVA